jgi:hypothetical protein
MGCASEGHSTDLALTHGGAKSKASLPSPVPESRCSVQAPILALLFLSPNLASVAAVGADFGLMHEALVSPKEAKDQWSIVQMAHAAFAAEKAPPPLTDRTSLF